MTIDEGNAFIAKFLEIKQKSDGKTYELNDKMSQVLKCKTTQFLKFNENLELLFIAVEKIGSIKGMTICTQFDSTCCYLSLLYKAELVEGEWRNARFMCERTKTIDKYKQGLFEILSSFCGWYYNHPDCQTEIEYEFHHLDDKQETSPNVVYMKPLEVVCPKCGKVYREEDIRKEE